MLWNRCLELFQLANPFQLWCTSAVVQENRDHGTFWHWAQHIVLWWRLHQSYSPDLVPWSWCSSVHLTNSIANHYVICKIQIELGRCHSRIRKMPQQNNNGERTVAKHLPTICGQVFLLEQQFVYYALRNVTQGDVWPLQTTANKWRLRTP